MKTVPNGRFYLGVSNVPGYTHDGWACYRTPGSVLPPETKFSSFLDQVDGRDRATLLGTDHMTCKITHRPVPGELTWTKVDSSDTPLKGSEWRLDGPEQITGGTQITVKDCVSAPCSEQMRDTDPAPGKFRITGLKWGTYTLTETRAPAGYLLNTTPISGTTENGQIGDLGKVRNDPIRTPAIPLTGGTASIFYVLAGGGLTVVAIAGAAAIGNRGMSRG